MEAIVEPPRLYLRRGITWSVACVTSCVSVCLCATAVKAERLYS